MAAVMPTTTTRWTPLPARTNFRKHAANDRLRSARPRLRTRDPQTDRLLGETHAGAGRRLEPSGGGGCRLREGWTSHFGRNTTRNLPAGMLLPAPFTGGILMTGVEQIKVDEDEDGMRLDRWFKQHYPGLGFGPLQKLLRSGQIRVDGGRAKSDTRVQAGQLVRVPPLGVDRKSGAPVTARTMRGVEDADVLSRILLYEDDKVLVFDKPSGLAVQGGSGVVRSVDSMLEAWRNKKGEKPRLVHRLDRDTSGVLVVARSRLAAMKLAESFKKRETKKTYWALVQGSAEAARGQDLHLAYQGANTGWRPHAGRQARRKGRGSCRDLLPGGRAGGPDHVLARDGALHRPHAPAARTRRLHRLPDHRRSEIFRGRPELGLSGRASEPAAPPCAPDRHPASRQGHDQRVRAPAAPYAPELEPDRLGRGGCGGGGLSQPLSVFEKRDHVDTLAVGMMLMLTFAWGFNQVLIKVSTEGYSPIFLTFARSTLAALVVFAWCHFRGIRLFEKDGTLIAGTIVGLLFGAEFALIFLGLDLTTAARGTLMINHHAVLGAARGPFLSRRGRSPRCAWAGVVLAFAGVALVFSDELSLPDRSALTGDLICLAAGMLWVPPPSSSR